MTRRMSENLGVALQFFGWTNVLDKVLNDVVCVRSSPSFLFNHTLLDAKLDDEHDHGQDNPRNRVFDESHYDNDN